MCSGLRISEKRKDSLSKKNPEKKKGGMKKVMLEIGYVDLAST